MLRSLFNLTYKQSNTKISNFIRNIAEHSHKIQEAQPDKNKRYMNTNKKFDEKQVDELPHSQLHLVRNKSSFIFKHTYLSFFRMML